MPPSSPRRQSERDPLRSVTTRALKTQEHAARVSLSAVPRGSTGYCQTQRSSFDLLYNFTLSHTRKYNLGRFQETRAPGPNGLRFFVFVHGEDCSDSA